jgi:hypothetical protein
MRFQTYVLSNLTNHGEKETLGKLDIADFRSVEHVEDMLFPPATYFSIIMGLWVVVAVMCILVGGFVWPSWTILGLAWGHF